MASEQTSTTGTFSLPRLLASTVALAVIGGGIWVYLYGLPDLGGSEEAAAATEAEAAPADSGAADGLAAPPAVPVPVETAIARRGDLVMKITATGTAEAARQVVVAAAESGFIDRLEVEEGDVVEQGQLLLALDDAELQLNLQRARERLVSTLANYAQNQLFVGEEATGGQAEAASQVLAGLVSPETLRALIDDPTFDSFFQSISREEVIAARDQLMATRADYAAAELAIERATVEAPFGGQIADMKVVQGQRVSAAAELFTLVDASPIRVRVEVLESEAGLVRRGREARVRFAAYPTETFTGRIETISPLVDPERKTLQVIVNLPNPNLRLKPGMFAQIALDTEIFQDRLLVPASAVLLRDDRPMLFVVRDGRSEWVYIQKGLENAETVEVLEGVEPGDEVIVSGHYSLAHDAAVRVIEPGDGSDDGDGAQ